MKDFQPIEDIKTPVISTPHLAFLLDKSVATLHQWSHYDKGPIKPIKIGRTLRWRTDDVRKLLGLPVKNLSA